MKSYAVASLILAASAVAQPHGHQHRRHHEQFHDKRDIVTHVEWVTETQYVTKLIDSTTTVWVSSGYVAPTSTTEHAEFIETPKVKAKPSTTSTSVYVAPVPTTTSTSTYVPPPPPTTSIVVQEPTTSVYVPPTTTSVYVAPPPKQPAKNIVQEPATTSAAPTSSNSGSSSGGSGSYSGDITYYNLGPNACGGSASGEDYSSNIVALPKDMMGGDGPTYASNPYCGKSITITANGKSVTGVVMDKCMGCVGGSIDVSMKIFTELFGSLDLGRGSCEWSFN